MPCCVDLNQAMKLEFGRNSLKCEKETNEIHDLSLLSANCKVVLNDPHTDVGYFYYYIIYLPIGIHSSDQDYAGSV